MSGRIVLFGATGYTGQLTAEALVARGRRPVLAGRSEKSLHRLVSRLGGSFEFAVADVDRPETVHQLVRPGDVLISCVGPFTKWGDPAVEAAIRAGVPYIDSTGEPPFIRRVFENFGPSAEAAGAPLLTAMGYDWVPGNLAAALALEEAGEAGVRVEVGYYMTGSGGGMSGGTQASVMATLLEPGFAYRGGGITTEPMARRVKSFLVRGRERPAVSAASSEHFALPQEFPRLQDVDAYLGWFGSASRPLQGMSYVFQGLQSAPPVKRVVGGVLGRFAQGSSGGPSTEQRATAGSHILAIARDSAGEALAEVRLEGADGYTFTAGMLAWAAVEALDGRIEGAGALGPGAAFGTERLEQGCAEAGISRV